MNAQLALALLAVGPIKSGLAGSAVAPLREPKSVVTPSKDADAPDPIAFLAREWLAKR